MRINEIIKAFSDIGSNEARSEAYLTLEFLFGVGRAEAMTHYEREYDKAKIDAVIEKRKKRIPLQYIFGEWYFMGKRFIVSEKCLIPRPDTEILVTKAIECIKRQGRVVDLCTGSGCIGLSLLTHRPDICDLTLVDISRDALSVAKENRALHHLEDRCNIAEGDATLDILDGMYDAVLSNPPYILSRDMDTLSDEVKKEPRIALDGGEDGLDIIRPIVYNSAPHINEGGYLMIEFGYDQEDSIRKLLTKAVGEGLYSEFELYHDYGGNIRMCVVKK